MLLFIGTARIKPDSAAEVQTALESYMPTVQSEEGTLDYIVYRGTKNPNMLVFFEKYRDQQALDAHRSTEELEKFLEVLKPAWDGEPIMWLVEEIVRLDR